MPEILVFGKVASIAAADISHSGAGKTLYAVDEDPAQADDTLDVPEASVMAQVL